MALITSLRTYFIFLLFIVVAYWQMSAGDGILRWDGPHCFLAWRYNVTELIRMGELPFWSTWQHLGFPLYGDPETGAWYPIVWLMAIFRSYDFYSLHFEWLLHVFIGACGVYRLVRTLSVDTLISTIAGICFAGCGVYVSNAQNFGFLIGLSWAPWVLHYFRMVFISWDYRSAAMFAFVFWMMFTGSYPAITFMLVYSLVIAAIYLTVRHGYLRQKEVYVARLKVLAVMVVLTVGLCAVHLVSILECLPEMTRTSGLSVEKLLENSFTWQAWASFVTPFAVGTNQAGYWESDFSMINAYSGLLTVLLLMIWVFTKGKTKAEWMMVSGFVFLMITAMGHDFPLRLWLAELPGLGVFRHPSIFRFLAVMILIVFAYSFLKRLWEFKSNRSILIGSVCLLVVLLFMTAISFRTQEADLSAYWNYWKNKEPQMYLMIDDRIFFQGLIQLIFLTGLTLALLKRWKYALMGLVFLDMTLAVQLNSQETVVYPFSFEKAQARLEAVEQGRGSYSGENISSIHSANDTLGIEVLIENEHMFLHRPSYDGYNSFILKSYNALEHDSLALQKLNHTLIYCTDSSLVDQFRIAGNSIEAELHNARSTRCIMLQNYLLGWTCHVDGQPVDVVKEDHTFCAVEIPAGATQISFTFHSAAAVYALIVTMCAFLAFLFLIIRARKINIE